MEERRRLESWKEIALYLKRSAGTCQRWEAELGLPIHRLDGTPKARVFAYTDELDRWMAEKLHAADALTTKAALIGLRKKKRVLISAGALVLLAVLAVFGWRFFPYPVPAPPQIPSLAVLPFENVSGEESLESWKNAFPDLLTTDLEQSRFVNAIPTIPLFVRLEELELAEAKKFSPEDLGKVAEKAEVEYVTTGSLMKTGEDIFITVFVQNPKSGEVIKTLRAHCRGEEGFFDAADDLSRKIKLAMNLTPRQVARDYDKAVRKISTESPEAFKLYSRELRLGSLKTSQEEIPLLQKAIELDPEFALAYERLYFKYRGAYRKEDSTKHGQKALEFSGRMSKRHFLLFLSGFSMYSRDYQKALKAGEKLWSVYPVFPQFEDVFGQWELPYLYMEFEEYDKAIQLLENLGPRYRKKSSVMGLLLNCYMAMGLYEKATKTLDDYVAANPAESGHFLYKYKMLAARQKKYDEALKYLDMEYSQRPVDYLYSHQRGYYFWIQDDFASAEKEYQKVFSQNNLSEQSQRALNLAVLSLSQGKLEEAKTIAKEAIELARSFTNLKEFRLRYEYAFLLAYLYFISGQLPEALQATEEVCRDYEQIGTRAGEAFLLRGSITLMMDRFEEFEKQAEEIKRIIRSDRLPQLMRTYYHLLGQRELKKNNIEGAIDYFGKALDLFKAPQNGVPAIYYYSLANAYYRANLPLNALEMYDKLTEPWVLRSLAGDLYAKSFYMKGMIYEKNVSQGVLYKKWVLGEDDKANAIKNYRKFLSLWGNADPIFPEVEDARRSLARLESESQVSKDK